MSIHAEKAAVDIKDGQLFKKMLAYAKPHWKTILLCIALAFLIVLTDLARPYIIKVAIDDRINGLHKPMYAARAEDAALLAPYGDPIVVGGRAYVRVDAGESAAPPRPPSDAVRPVRIVEAGGAAYLADGWPDPKTEPTVRLDGDRAVLEAAGLAFAAEPLGAETVEALRERDVRGFFVLGALFLIAVVGGAALSYVQTNLLQYTGQHIIFRIRQQLFDHLSRMSSSFFDRNPVGRLVVRVTQDTESLNQLYSQVIVNLVKDVIVLFGILIIMLQMSLKLTALMLVVIPLLFGMTVWYRIVVREAQRKMRLLLARLNSFLAENLSGIRITQLFVREERQLEQFRRLNGEHYKAGMRGTVINSIFQPAVGFLGNFAIALLIWYGGGSVLDGTITFGIVYAFTHYVRQFFNPLMSLAEKYNQIQTAMVGAERIFDMLDEKPAIVDAAEPKPLPRPVRGTIEFDRVWFAYNEGEWVLRDVSFRIEPGQTVAFVGATGAGKSSIIQLINRFYDIQQGTIRLDGIDIRDIPLDQLRRTIGVVQQDVFLFNGDIASNIRLNEAGITDEQVREAARLAHADEFVAKLPLGYATPLGERGVNLSLGQRQLLSFARAVAFRPQILILDEATSNIDTETELVVQDALREMTINRTTLIVAHRLSTIQHADQIIVMHKGKVREIGSHYQLLANKGYYYKLFELQYKEQKQMRDAR
ncbi:ABC transporter ATP-binding protein [Paenibacillus flagellatus]|uniref:ABC transporter ATP-binding protein n=1 Tax=Paenibacillus flagellatus TaxID=2211139 RepID=A0A2V5JX51_9BACL|nr:ABC transporter ATP-binding protein [Paenibacillus flagellatus]PYI50792.1 ABC transporter ATP-binding protein [Paenibacillus flagellatus]